jgi:cytochrome c oxidase cbb3-type subunit 3
MNDQEKKDKELLLDHNYDGIQEFDYPLPTWWLMILFGTIIFGIGYAGYYLTGMGPSQREELKVSLQEIEAKKPAGGPAGIEDLLVIASLNDSEKLKHGQETFAGKCVACHGDKGQGIIGPNLTDDSWIHGTGSPGEIAMVIRDGVADKGMPTWSQLLTAQEILDVAAYVRSIHGTNPAGAKAAQGDVHPFKVF